MSGPVGEHHNDLSRHMGKIVRDRTICPVRVHSWDEIDNSAKEHMWQSVLVMFNKIIFITILTAFVTFIYKYLFSFLFM